MKINFEYTKKEYKKYLIKSRFINNIILFIIGVVIYLFLTFKDLSLIYLPLFMIGLIILIYLINLFYAYIYIKYNEMLNYNTYGKYTLEITPNKFSVTVNNNKVDYKYSSVKKVLEKRNFLVIKLKKTREYLIFEKRLFNENDYKKMIELFKKYVK